MMTGTINSELMRGSLNMMILSILAEESQYGYLMQQKLRDASREMVDLKAGTLYPILHRLEADKFIRSRWDKSTGRKRKWYDITAAGKKQLSKQAIEWQTYVECIQNLLGQVNLSPKPAC
jgi:PadR family transcriptional regulator